VLAENLSIDRTNITPYLCLILTQPTYSVLLLNAILASQSVILTTCGLHLNYPVYTTDTVHQSYPSLQGGLQQEITLLVKVVLVVVFHEVHIMDVLTYLVVLGAVFLQILVGVVVHLNSYRILLKNSYCNIVIFFVVKLWVIIPIGANEQV
jgi:hypothetical protein